MLFGLFAKSVFGLGVLFVILVVKPFNHIIAKIILGRQFIKHFISLVNNRSKILFDFFVFCPDFDLTIEIFFLSPQSLRLIVQYSSYYYNLYFLAILFTAVVYLSERPCTAFVTVSAQNSLTLVIEYLPYPFFVLSPRHFRYNKEISFPAACAFAAVNELFHVE